MGAQDKKYLDCCNTTIQDGDHNNDGIHGNNLFIFFLNMWRLKINQDFMLYQCTLIGDNLKYKCYNIFPKWLCNIDYSTKPLAAQKSKLLKRTYHALGHCSQQWSHLAASVLLALSFSPCSYTWQMCIARSAPEQNTFSSISSKLFYPLHIGTCKVDKSTINRNWYGTGIENRHIGYFV